MYHSIHQFAPHHTFTQAVSPPLPEHLKEHLIITVMATECSDDNEDNEDYRPPLPGRPLLRGDGPPKAAELVRLSSTHLKRSFDMVFSCVMFAALAVAAWAITCITARRPINAHSYSYDRHWAVKHPNQFLDQQHSGAYGVIECENYVKASKMMQAIVAILTVPLTSAVCSQAAVVYLQRAGQRGRGPTLRQAMTLADKSWTEPLVVLKMFFRWNWRRKGSRFFALAVSLTLWGKRCTGIANPLANEGHSIHYSLHVMPNT